ncbi:MAG: spore coat protein [Bacillota bacterium]
MDDKAITLDLLTAAKQDVTMFANALNETANPELRGVLAQQLQQAQKSQERIFDYAKNKGYYNPYSTPEQMVAQDIQASKQVMSQFKDLT